MWEGASVPWLATLRDGMRDWTGRARIELNSLNVG